MAIVDLANYPIYIDESYDIINQYIDELSPTQVFIIVDENTEQLCLPILKKKLHLDFLSLRIPSGEKYKSINTCETLWKTIAQQGGDRKSLVINLGGGVIGDMGGFVAATYMRGIPFIQMPTTLLSQVDASVGSKLAIDLDNYKNMVGLFHDPNMVWIDTSFLATLDNRQLVNGFAEVIKHALIRSRALWNRITNASFSLQSVDWKKMVLDNVEIKKHVVEQDMKEGGLRKVLNFGHTIGHAIESHFLSTHKELLHGEAIAIGMICEAYISFKLAKLDNSELDEINKLILSLYDKKEIADQDISPIIEVIKYDKKNKGGNNRFSLISEIGKSIYDQEVDEELIIESIKYYQSL